MWLRRFAVSQARAKPAVDEASARVVNMSTHGASGHQRLMLSLDKAAVVQLDADARDVLVSNPIWSTRWCARRAASSCWPSRWARPTPSSSTAQGKQILALDIRVEKDVADLASMMKASLPNSSIRCRR